MVARVAHRLGELLHRDGRRREVGVAEREVDHVFAGAPELHLQRVDLRERVRRQRVDPAELHDAGYPRVRRGRVLSGPVRPALVQSRATTVARCPHRRRCCSTSAASSTSPITIGSSARSRVPSVNVSRRRARPRALRGRRAVHRRLRRRARLEGPLARVPRRVHHRVRRRATTRASAKRCTSTSTASSRPGRCGRGSSPARSTGCARSSHRRARRHHLERRRIGRATARRAGSAAGRPGHRRRGRVRDRLRRGRREQARSPDLPHRARRDRRRSRRRVVRRRHARHRRGRARAPRGCGRS